MNSNIFENLIKTEINLIPESGAVTGSYSCTWLRFDVFNSVMGTTAEYVDVAYIAMCDDLQTAITTDRSVDSALVRLSSAETRYYSTETGKVK